MRASLQRSVICLAKERIRKVRHCCLTIALLPSPPRLQHCPPAFRSPRSFRPLPTLLQLSSPSGPSSGLHYFHRAGVCYHHKHTFLILHSASALLGRLYLPTRWPMCLPRASIWETSHVMVCLRLQTLGWICHHDCTRLNQG